MISDRLLPVLRLLKWLLVAALVAVPALLIFPAIQQAREAARRSQSKNNLKQIGLGLHNYHDTFQMFPPGGVFSADGAPYNCWTTGIRPFLDASPFFNGVDFNRPWDDPASNYDHYLNRGRIAAFVNPGIAETRTPEGLQLAHYAGSDRIFHRNSSVGIDDLENGTSEKLLAGDANGQYLPLGYPFNWRDADLGMRTSPEGFGYEVLPSSHMLMADGTVRWFGDDTDPQILEALAGGETLKPSDAARAGPAVPFQPPSRYWRRSDVRLKNGSWIRIVRDPDDVEVSIVLPDPYLSKFDERPGDAQAPELLEHATIRELTSTDCLTDVGLARLKEFRLLERLSLSGSKITDAGLKHLQRISMLKRLTLKGTRVTSAGMESFLAARPDVELNVPEDLRKSKSPDDRASDESSDRRAPPE